MSNSEVRGQLLSGNQVASDIRQQLKEEISKIREKYDFFKPGLAIVQVGDREDSNVYIRQKLKGAEECGMWAEHMKMPRSTTQFELLDKLQQLNNDPNVHGIIVQLPLESDHPIDTHLVTNSIAASKDVDGLGQDNAGKLSRGDMKDCIVPCTPRGCLELIHRSGVNVKGKHCVVLGRSKIVGSPMANLLTWNHATVTLCHSRTRNIQEECLRADILVVAIGQPEFVKGDWVKEGAIVIDCGINSIADPRKASGKRLVGDVDFNAAKERASWITPVPGGVGPMTVAMLLKNTVDGAVLKLNTNMGGQWHLSPLLLETKSPVPTNVVVGLSQSPQLIRQLAQDIGLLPEEIEPYGKTQVKVSLDVLDRLQYTPNGKYIVVAGIAPTLCSEGKTSTALGLAQALGAHLHRNTFACLSSPSSEGPIGGGYAQVIPLDEFTSHLTGDLSAVSSANNLFAAALDNRLYNESSLSDGALFDRLVPEVNGKREFCPAQIRRLQRLGIKKTKPNELTEEECVRFSRLKIDPNTISWQPVNPTTERFMRQLNEGSPELQLHHAWEGPFSTTVASEILSVLALSSSLGDLRKRIGKIIVAMDDEQLPVTADDLGVTGAITVLLKNAIRPNLMQTLEGTPVFLHANNSPSIGRGSSSIVADKLALKLVGEKGFVVTESTIGGGRGLEKFFDLKCRYSGLQPSTVVLVVSVRSLKILGGGPALSANTTLPHEYAFQNLALVALGGQVMQREIVHARKFGAPVVVAINAFDSDTDAELQLIVEKAVEAGAERAILSRHWAEGGVGATSLAEVVIDASDKVSNLNFLYSSDKSPLEKIQIIAHETYGFDEIALQAKARQALDLCVKQGFGELPICMSKVLPNPMREGPVKNTVFAVRDLKVNAGAGFIYPLLARRDYHTKTYVSQRNIQMMYLLLKKIGHV